MCALWSVLTNTPNQQDINIKSILLDIIYIKIKNKRVIFIWKKNINIQAWERQPTYYYI